MNIAFTLCSNNYFASARTLADSFLKYHEDFIFVIGLVDRFDDSVNYQFSNPAEILKVEDLAIPELDALVQKFNITELNTAVKPSYFNRLFQKYGADKVLYIDPDILVVSRFQEAIDALDTANILLTPHLLSPVDDGFIPSDYHTLRGGVFNLGFLGLSNYDSLKSFLVFWHNRVVKYGFSNLQMTMFYDQIWMNYVPCFYDNYIILKHPGYNMANWNLHERHLTQDAQGNYFVNDVYPLRFFHFSSFHYDKPDIICSYLNRYNFTNRPDLREIFTVYKDVLISNGIAKTSKAPVHFYPRLRDDIVTTSKRSYIAAKIIKRLRLATRTLISGHGQ